MIELSIFVSSPGDVAEERIIAKRVIGRVQAEFAGRIQFSPVFWEHEPLLASGSFQEQLPRPSDCDIVVCILWARLGTRLPASFRKANGAPYDSGTEFEFEDALAGWRSRGRPNLLVYRKTATPVLPPDDEQAALERLRQKQALDQFMRRWFHDESDGTLKKAFHPFASAADFEEILEAHLRRLASRRSPEGSGKSREASASWQAGSPFRGLQAFEIEHAAIFFGRTAAVAAMLNALRQQDAEGRPFLLVLGSSGSGKSSLVRAGLIPLLVQPGVIEGVRAWKTCIFRPRDAAGDLSGTVTRLLDGDTPATDRILLLVDQLEEIFTDERIGETERSAFMALVTALVASRRVWIVATLRSDFYPRCSELPELLTLKAGAGQYDVRPPSATEIGQIIRLPAVAAGLRFDVTPERGESLDEVLRDAAVRSPETLPLLEFALEELYQRRSADGTLTFHAYNEIGGVEGALAQRAEAVVAALPQDAQEALPVALRLLVSVDSDEQELAGRRVAPLAGFPPAARTLIDAMIEARLCISELDAQARPVVTLAHEALLRHWPRARDWLAADRDLLRAHGRLTIAASRWLHEGRTNDLLLASGKPLDEARAVRNSGFALEPWEIELVAASDRRARRARRLRTAAVSSLAVLAIAAATAAWLANEQRVRAQNEMSTTEQTMDFMVSLFAIADPTEGRGEKVTVREILDSGARQIESGLTQQPVVQASLMTAMGRAYTGLGLHGPAVRLLETAVEKRASLTGPDAKPTTESRAALAAALYIKGDYEQARDAYRKALDDSLKLAPQGDALVSQNMNGLALALVELDDLPEAERLYRRALDIDVRLHGRRHVETARTLRGLGTTLFGAGRYRESRPFLEEAHTVFEQLLGDSSARTAESLNELAVLDYQEGRYADASRKWLALLDTYREVLGPEHPEIASIGNNLGRSQLMLGDIDASYRSYVAALALDRRSKPAGHDDFATPLNSLAMIALARGQFDEARKNLDEALSIGRAHDHWLLDQILLNEADLDARTGDLAGADDAMTEAAERLAKQYPLAEMPEEKWRYALQDGVRGLILTNRKQYAEAEKLLTASLPVIEKRFGKGRFYTDLVHERLVHLYQRSGRPALAARHVREIRNRQRLQ